MRETSTTGAAVAVGAGGSFAVDGLSSRARAALEQREGGALRAALGFGALDGR